MANQLVKMDQKYTDDVISLGKIMDKGSSVFNDKYKSVKYESMKANKMIEKYQSEYNKIREKCKSYQEKVKELEKEIRKLNKHKDWLEKENKDFRKKLFKFEKDVDVCILNPFEMHERMRYYENMYEIRYVNGK